MFAKTKIIRMWKSSYASPQKIIGRGECGEVGEAEAAELLRLGFAKPATIQELRQQEREKRLAMAGVTATS